jgi:uncharacterized protein YyaL (SSP411 family)
MLYDNALLSVAYGEAYQVTKDEFYRGVVKGILDFMIREMQDERGGFYSSLDADSEGEEGRFYVWQKSEIDRLLKDESDIFCRFFNVTHEGNFEHRLNILNIDGNSEAFKAGPGLGNAGFERTIERQKQVLMVERSKRTRPFTDDKILTSWNGLAISAMSRGYQVTRDTRYREAALGAATFIRGSLFRDGHLLHSYRMGRTSEVPLLEDYSYLTQGLIDLYEVVFDFEWIELAYRLAANAIGLFSDADGNVFLSPAGQSDHFMRPREVADGALPAPGSVLAQSLLRLADITGDRKLKQQAERIIMAVSNDIDRMPSNMTSAISAFSYLNGTTAEVILVGTNNRQAFLDEIYSTYLPNRVIVVSDSGEELIPLLKGKEPRGNTVAYVCKNLVCRQPADTPGDLREQLRKIAAEK